MNRIYIRYFNRTRTFLQKNTADTKESSCFRATFSSGLSQTISNWMQQSSSWEVNMRPATQEQRVLRNPNFRRFNVFTTFRHWDLSPGIKMGFTPSHPVSYISILPATSTYSTGEFFRFSNSQFLFISYCFHACYSPAQHVLLYLNLLITLGDCCILWRSQWHIFQSCTTSY
jgi:hypothetical protein